MGRFLPYAPDQAYLVPPSVKDELGEDHLCFFIHEAVEHMDLQCFEQVYGEEGGELYGPALCGESSGRRRVFLAGKHHRTGRPRVGCVRAGFELGTGVEHGTALSANPAQQNPAAYAAEVARANRTSGLSATQGFSRTGAGKLKRTTRNEAISVTGIGESEPRVHPGCHLVQSDPDPGQPLAGPPYIAMSATGPHRQRVLTRSLKPRWSHLAG